MSAARRLLTAVALSLAVAGAGGATTASTSKHLVRPFVNGKLSPRVHVVRAGRGHCGTGSGADFGRSDAWRCFIGNLIYDPCFSSPKASSASFVVCPTVPWSARAVKIVLTRRLPLEERNPEGGPMRGRPWGIKLPSGKGCTALTGATGTVAGQGISFGCSGGGVLLGLPRRAGAMWTISYATSYKARRVTRVKIAQAWW